MTQDADRAIDCLVNVHFGETEQQPAWMLKVRDDYFKGPKSISPRSTCPSCSRRWTPMVSPRRS
jgi:hypothetical protein